MKHNYTDTELQAAIDEACNEVAQSAIGFLNTLDLDPQSEVWAEETPARLQLIESALAALPEQCETQRISLEQLFQKPNAIADELQLSQLRPLSEAGEVPEGCARYYTYKKDGEWTTKSKYRAMQDTHYIDTRLPESAEKPEPLVAEHKALTADEWAERWQAEVDARNRQYNELECTRAIAEKALTELAKTKENGLSQLRPIAEAEPVPEGCVRYHFSKYGDDIGVGTIAKHPSDVLFADIRLPEPSEKPAPTPLVTEPISLPEWTPVVGDVVTLKSGGPKMTVMQELGHNFLCAYDSLGEVKTVSIPTNCLQPA